MITRIWHGRTKKEDADVYREYVINTGVDEYHKSAGNLDVQIWQREDGDESHIWTVTKWKDIDSVKTFAGNDFEKAKYYPEDKKYLLEFEPKVIHCNTFSFSNLKIENFIRQFEELYNGESFIGKLGNLDAEKAFVQPLPGNHSVAEVLWHCIYWRNVVLKRIQGDYQFGERTQKEQNFLPVVILKQKGWINLLKELEKSQVSIIEFLKTKNDNFLEEEFKPGSKNELEIEGIIQHDNYHLGQIGLIISLLKNSSVK